jgi:large subunit ribosomal protein L25
MAELKLQATKRTESGKGAAHRSRAAGRVPAVLYGRGMEPVSLEVDRREFVTALKTDSGMNVLLDIEFDGTNTLALTRELQRDPVRGTLLHADFVKVDRTQAIEIEVPVHLVGEAQGTKEGGALEHPLFSVHVRTLPGNVPEAIDADVSALNIGDTLRVADLRAPADVEILNDPEAVVASIAAPISEEELEAMEAEAGIEMEAPEAEAAEEGAAPADEEGAPAEEPSEES